MSSTSEFDLVFAQAKSFARKKDYSQAIELFRKALELDENNTEVHRNLATVYFLTQNYDLSIEHFSRITELDPLDGKAYINLGAVFNRTGDYAKAIEALRKGVQRDRKCSEGYYNLGIAHRQLNQLSMAVSAYREAIRLSPEMVDAHQNLANAYFHLGNFQQSIQHYKKALEINPRFQKAERGLAKANEALDKQRSEISPFGRLVDQNSHSGRTVPAIHRELSQKERLQDRKAVQDLTGKISEATGDVVEHIKDELEPALMGLNRALVDSPDASPELYRAYEKFQEALGKYRELRKQLKRRCLELRAHEELLNPPDLKSPK